MNHSYLPQATILVASNNSADAHLVKNLLIPRFDQVFISTDPDRMADAFKHYSPDVLVLAFNNVVSSERYYLDLCPLNERMLRQSHRTIALCNKDEVQRTYEMCLEGIFDDYVLFWPMTLDAPRLLMSIHNALRELAVRKNVFSSSEAESEIQADRFGQRQGQLEQQKAEDNIRLAMTGYALTHAEQGLSAALDRFSRQLTSPGGHSIVDDKILAALRSELVQLKYEALQPLKEWVDKLQRTQLQPLESPRNLNETTPHVPPTILVVDDDEFLLKMVGQILQAEHYKLIFASSGFEAMDILNITLPDLILMDVMMPDINGIETLKKIKSIPKFANVPVIMLTGRSEGAVVIESLKAGARDFIVKPFDRKKLIAKVSSIV